MWNSLGFLVVAVATLQSVAKETSGLKGNLEPLNPISQGSSWALRLKREGLCLHLARPKPSQEQQKHEDGEFISE